MTTHNLSRSLIRRNPSFMFLAIVIILLPILVLVFAWANGKIELDVPKLAIIATLLAGWPPAVWYVTDWLLKIFSNVERQSPPDFPYKTFSPTDLPSHLSTLSRPDIPYVPRLPPSAFKQMLRVMSDAQYLLIIGRTGLGKTREAVELIKRIELESGEDVTVLVPDGVLDIPLKISGERINRRVILFVDDLPSRYAEAYRVTNINDVKSVADNFRERFEQTLRQFKDYYGSKFYFIATAIGEPDFRARLQLGDPFWKQFKVYELPDLASECRREFLKALENSLEIEISEEAKDLLTERSDGTYSGLIVPLVRERSKRKIDLDDAKQYGFTYPQDWEQRVYKSVFEPNVYRRNVLAALSIVRQAELEPYEFLIIDLAARLVSKEILFWHRWRLRRELKNLSDWIEVSDGLLSCPDAYLLDKGDLAQSQQILLQSVFHLIGRKTHAHHLRSSLYQFINVLRFNLGDPWSALEINKRFLDISPQNGRAWNRLALIYLQLDEHQLAEKACLTAISFSNHSTGWSTLAAIYAAQKNYQKAIRACRSAIERDEERAIFWAYLGVLFSKVGDLEAAIQAGERAVDLDPYNPFAHISLGISYDQAGRLDKAIETCNRAIMLDGLNATSWQTLGVTFSKAKRFEEAIKACTKATELEPDSPAAWSVLARTYEDSQRFEEAIVAYEKAVNLEPHNARNWLSLGIALDHAGHSQEGFAVLKEATDLNPELVPAWQALARSAGVVGQIDVVFSALTKVTGLVPKSASGWLSLGVQYARSRRYKEAASALRKATELQPNSIKAWKSLFSVNNKLRDYRSALNAIQRLSALEPEDLSKLYKLGIAYNRALQPEKAVEVLEKVVEAAPEMVVAWQALRRIHKRANNPEKVLAISSKLVELEPKNGESWFVLGIAYKNSGEMSKAADALCKAAIYSARRELLIPAMKWLENLQPPPNALVRLANLVYEAQKVRDEDDFTEAIRLCNRAIAIDPDAIGAWRTLSSSYRRSGKHEEALIAAKHVVRIFSGTAEGWYVLGLRHDHFGQTAEATKAYEQALSLDASHGLARRKLAEKLTSSGDSLKALRLLRRLVMDDPKNAKNWILYGRVLVRMGRYGQATYAFDRVAKFVPHTVKWTITLGELYLLSRSFENARAAFREALDLDSESEEAINGLSRCDELELKYPRVHVVKEQGVTTTEVRYN